MASGSVYCGWAVGVVGFTVLGFREQLRLAVANSGPELFPVDGAIRRHGQLAGLAGNAGAGNLLQQGKAFAQLPGVRAQGKQAAELALGSAEVLVGFISEWILFRQYPGDVSEHHVVDVAVFAWIRFAAINNGRGVNWQIAAVIEGKQWLELPCDGGGGYQHNALHTCIYHNIRRTVVVENPLIQRPDQIRPAGYHGNTHIRHSTTPAPTNKGPTISCEYLLPGQTDLP